MTKAELQAENNNLRAENSGLLANGSRLRAALVWFHGRHREYECIDDEFCQPCEIARAGFEEAA